MKLVPQQFFQWHNRAPRHAWPRGRASVDKDPVAVDGTWQGRCRNQGSKWWYNVGPPSYVDLLRLGDFNRIKNHQWEYVSTSTMCRPRSWKLKVDL